MTPGGSWTVSWAGEAGAFDKDSDAMFALAAGNLDFSASVRLGGPDTTTGGAGR